MPGPQAAYGSRHDADMWQAMREEERCLAAALTRRLLQLLVLATIVAAAAIFAVATAFGIAQAVAAALIVGSAAARATRV